MRRFCDIFLFQSVNLFFFFILVVYSSSGTIEKVGYDKTQKKLLYRSKVLHFTSCYGKKRRKKVFPCETKAGGSKFAYSGLSDIAAAAAAAAAAANAVTMR